MPHARNLPPDFHHFGDYSPDIALMNQMGKGFGVWAPDVKYPNGFMAYHWTGTYAAIWISIQDSNVGHVPDVSPTWWVPYNVAPGASVIPPYYPEWDPLYAYSTQQMVSYGGETWISVTPTTGVTPGTDTSAWIQLTPSPEIARYEPNHIYVIGRMTSTDTGIYRAINNNYGIYPDTNPARWELIAPLPSSTIQEDNIILIAGQLTYPLTATPQPGMPVWGNIEGHGLRIDEFTIAGSQITLIPAEMTYAHQTGYAMRVFYLPT